MDFKIPAFLFIGITQSLFAEAPPETVQKNTILNIVDIIAVPRYPRLAHLSGQSGQFLATMKVSREGKGEVVSIDGGSKIIVESIRKSLNAWTFLPQKEEVQMTIQFEFRLISEGPKDSELAIEILPETNKVVVKARKISVVRSSGY